HFHRVENAVDAVLFGFKTIAQLSGHRQRPAFARRTGQHQFAQRIGQAVRLLPQCEGQKTGATADMRRLQVGTADIQAEYETVHPCLIHDQVAEIWYNLRRRAVPRRISSGRDRHRTWRDWDESEPPLQGNSAGPAPRFLPGRPRGELYLCGPGPGSVGLDG